LGLGKFEKSTTFKITNHTKSKKGTSLFSTKQTLNYFKTMMERFLVKSEKEEEEE
jgi:hypothetical protein